jgi:hypothetical protein
LRQQLAQRAPFVVLLPGEEPQQTLFEAEIQMDSGSVVPDTADRDRR